MRSRSFALLVPIWLALVAPAGAQPRLLAPGIVSTGDSESHALVSPDGRELYFLKLSPDFAHWTVVVARRRGDSWGAPGIAWFSGRYDDADVSFAPDGATIWFVSDRPDRDGDPARGDTDIFRMRRTEGGWGAPERIVELASSGFEWFPNATADGALYFGSERHEGNFGPEGTSDLWRAPWLGDRFGAPENLGPRINGAGQEIEPWVSPDGGMLVFAAKGRPGGLGSYDLYVALRCRGEWSEPRPLGGGVNSPAWEFGGRFSPDGRTFYFASNRERAEGAGAAPPGGRAGYAALLERLRSPGNGLFDIYEIPAAELGLGDPCGG